LCCGLVPGLTSALLVPILAGCAKAVRRAHPWSLRHAPEALTDKAQSGVCDGSTLAWCALSALIATVWLSVEVWPLSCRRLCESHCPLNAGSVGVCGLIFGLQGVMAGLAMLHATPAPNRAVAANSQGLAAKDTAPGEPQPEAMPGTVLPIRPGPLVAQPTATSRAVFIGSVEMKVDGP